MLGRLRSCCYAREPWIVLQPSFMARNRTAHGAVRKLQEPDQPRRRRTVGAARRQVSGRNRWALLHGCAGSKANKQVVRRRWSHGSERHGRVDRVVAGIIATSGSSDRAFTAINGVPRLVVSRSLRRAPEAHDPGREYQFRYLDRHHSELPHVVKYSGGRSSGMLLLTLLENGILQPERGDVVVFNNTSSEHPHTYEFVRECKVATEQRGIPFFMVEFQTYEDARKGEWTRLPSYRLVSDVPWSDDDNETGFHWKGEVFEEVMSWSGFVPNQFRRICTTNMKLAATRLFLRDWLAAKESIPRQGHFGSSSRIDGEAMYARHRRNGGEVPEQIYIAKKRYGWSRPHFRPEQRYADFSSAWKPFENPWLAGKSQGDAAVFGKGGVEYVALVGLRADEPARVGRVKERNSGPEASGYEGEHVYMPLVDMHVAAADVNAFWDRQEWDLSLPPDSGLSNCVYCFLKGGATLRKVHSEMESARQQRGPSGYGPLEGTPCDVAWWERMEDDYGRDLVAEERVIQSSELAHDFLGFFGAGSRYTYRFLREADETELAEFDDSVLPCDCTD